MLLIPYRVKNPWKRFPIVTVILIGLNVLIYLLTTEAFLQIREEVIDKFAYQMGVSSIFSIFSAMFLHGDLLHLLGNMLFFWVFGPAVEDRLGIWRFLLVYFVAGIVGSLLQGGIDIAMHGSTLPGIGASGAVMGVLGAYWFLFSWSTVCVFYLFFIVFFIRWGIWEVQALWIIGLYVVIDLAQGIFGGSANGVANFAHVGGGVAGALLCLALRARRDSAEVSRVKHTQAEVKDLSLLSVSELEKLYRADPQNMELFRTVVSLAKRKNNPLLLHHAYEIAGPTLIDREPELLGHYLLTHEDRHTCYTVRQLMRVARHLESSADPLHAITLYQTILLKKNSTPEHETLLYRLAFCCWTHLHDAEYARTYLDILLLRYPFGTMEAQARALLRKIGAKE